jgi:hypothetical protein
VLENAVLRKTFGAQREAVVRGYRKLNSEELHGVLPVLHNIYYSGDQSKDGR